MALQLKQRKQLKDEADIIWKYIKQYFEFILYLQVDVQNNKQKKIIKSLIFLSYFLGRREKQWKDEAEIVEIGTKPSSG